VVPPLKVPMRQVEHTPSSTASKHIARAASLLNRAEHHLRTASFTAPDHYHQDQLQGLAFDLRSLDAPLSRLSYSVRSEGER
jgi:hypothetical protein